MNDHDLLPVLHAAADDVRAALGDVVDWGLADTVPGQYRSDLAADAVAVSALVGAGLGVLSEESGRHEADRDITVVVDPLDGSTNASRGIPWFATSFCAVDSEGPRAAVVVNLVSGDRFEAVRGRGARLNGHTITPSTAADLGDALVGVSGFPPQPLGWRQYRALGAAALDLCLVACGSIDAYIDCSADAHGSWDYLGGLLVCLEAGASVVDAKDRELVVLDHQARRTPVAAATPDLLAQVLDARRSAGI